MKRYQITFLRRSLFGLIGGLMVAGGATAQAAAPTTPVATGLKLWLKADTGVEVGEGGGVVEWRDQSGSGHHASQADPTMGPKVAPNAINSKPALRFDGADDYLDVAHAETLNVTGDVTSFFVVKFDDFDTYRAVWAKTENNLPAPIDYYLLPGTGIPRAYRGDGTSANLASFDGVNAVRPGAFLVLGFESEGKTFTHYFNGQEAGSADINVEYGDTGQNIKIGSRSDLFTKMKGDIAELLIYDVALSDTDRNLVFDYLKTKYNLLNLSPSVTITAPANNATIAAPGEFKLRATASDPDDRVARVEFTANGALIGTVFAAPYELTVKVETPGPITFGARVVDSKDAVATAATVPVTITGPSAAPALEANPNLKLWLKADAITGEPNSPVASWTDSSGNNHEAIAEATESTPILVPTGVNGKPAVRFDGTDDFLRIAENEALSLASQDLATYAIVRPDDFATFRAIWSQTAGAGGNLPRPNDWYLVAGSGISRFYRGTDEGNINAFVDAGAVAANVPVMAGFEQQGITATASINGRQTGTAQFNFTPTDSSTDLLIGTRTDGVTKMKGDIAEILIFEGVLTAAQRENLRKYLGSKYNISIFSLVNLPPVVQITTPAPNGHYNTGDEVTLTATATDADGSVQRVEFFANGSPIGSSTGPIYTAKIRLNAPGEIVFTAVAVDNQNLRTTSAAVPAMAMGAVPEINAQGIKLWLRADKGVTLGEGGAVTAWADFSGSFNNAAQAAIDAAPSVLANGINGKPAIHFDGVNDYLSILASPSLAMTGDLTAFYVVRMDDFATFRAILTKTGGNLPRPIDWYTQPNSGNPTLFRGGPAGFNNFQGTTPLTAGEWQVVGFDVDTANVTANHYLNGENNGSVTLTFPAIDVGAPVLIGTRGDLFTKMKGDIAEILVYDRLLNETDRAAVATYLNNRYRFGQVAVTLSVSATTVNSITFAWPMAAGNFALERTTNFVTWTPVTNPGVMVGDNMTVTVNTVETAGFFRLKQQP